MVVVVTVTAAAVGVECQGSVTMAASAAEGAPNFRCWGVAGADRICGVFIVVPVVSILDSIVVGESKKR